jgi:inner membrane protein involved in colicin E2 resistance
MGSLLLFGVLATLMIATRQIDWSNVVRLQRNADAKD